jgi:hypothetical protein
MKLQISVALEENDEKDFSIEIAGQTLTPENGVIFVDAKDLQPAHD